VSELIPWFKQTNWTKILIGLFVLVILPFILSKFYLHLLTTILIMSLFAMSFNLLLGYTGIVSFGHSAFFGMGAYGFALLTIKTELPWFLNICFAPVIGAITAFIVGYFCIRLQGILFSMLTLAFSQIFYAIIHQWYGFTGGDNGIVGLPRPEFLISDHAFYHFTAAIFVVGVAILWRLVHSPFGYTLWAIRENSLRSSFIGIEVNRHRLIIFTITGAFAGFAGVLFAMQDRQVFPNFLHWSLSTEVLIMALLGGMFTFAGPAVGAMLINLLRYWLSAYTLYWMIFLGAILLVIVLFLQKGILGAITERMKPPELRI
jgi:branched-chain amino acid transport system permease protein